MLCIQNNNFIWQRKAYIILRRVLCGVGADVEMVDFTSAIQEEPNAVITMIITSKT